MKTNKTGMYLKNAIGEFDLSVIENITSEIGFVFSFRMSN